MRSDSMESMGDVNAALNNPPYIPAAVGDGANLMNAQQANAACNSYNGSQTQSQSQHGNVVNGNGGNTINMGNVNPNGGNNAITNNNVNNNLHLNNNNTANNTNNNNNNTANTMQSNMHSHQGQMQQQQQQHHSQDMMINLQHIKQDYDLTTL